MLSGAPLFCLLILLERTYGNPIDVKNENSDNQNGTTSSVTDGKDKQEPQNLSDLIDEELRRLKIATTDCEGRITAISEQIEENPDKALNYRDRGICHLIMNKFEEATIDFEQWAKIEPNNAVGALNLVDKLSKLEKLDDLQGTSRNEKMKKAILESGGENELLKTLIRVREILEMRKKESKSADGDIVEGNIDEEVEKWRKYMSELESLIEENPNEPTYYRNLGICYMIMEDFDSALPKFRKWLEIEPEGGVVTFFMGEIMFSMENFDKAQEYYEKVLELSKNREVSFAKEDSISVDHMIAMSEQKLEKIKHTKQEKSSPDLKSKK